MHGCEIPAKMVADVGLFAAAFGVAFGKVQVGDSYGELTGASMSFNMEGILI